MSAIPGWITTSFGDIAALVKGVAYASEDYCELGQGVVFFTIKCVSKNVVSSLKGSSISKGGSNLLRNYNQEMC